MKKRVLLTSIIAIVVLALVCGLLAIPNQFAEFGNNAYSGYETIFAFKIIDGKNYHTDNYGGRPSVLGIISLVFILLGAISLAFTKKSKSLPVLGGVCVSLSGLFFLLMDLSLATIYKRKIALYWETYVVGGILLLLGIYLIYIGILYIREDKIGSKADSKQYSYLKSNKKEN
ncbi:MAG: hypothetical protein MJ221_04545 [Bacilli bacterium]|nr:hypothetical protein [Bacilli bacterium]